MWTRRTVLRALASAPAATALAACGGTGRRRRTGPDSGNTAQVDPSEIVRGIVDRLEATYPIATGLVIQRRLGGAAVDPGEQGVNVEASASAVLTVFDGTRWFEHSTTDTSREALIDAERGLRANAGEPGKRPGSRDQRTTGEFSTPMTVDPFDVPPTDWLGLASILYDRAQSQGGSRIVYRGAYLTVDDSTISFIGDGRDLKQRIVRTRAGVLFVASTGGATSSEEAVHGTTGDLSAANLAPDALLAAAERALSALTARPARGGDLEVILDPSLSALIAEQCIVPALSGARWVSGESALARSAGSALGSSLITLSDDATVEGALGSYFFDDEGWAPVRVDLIDRGRLAASLTDRASAAALGKGRTGHGRRGPTGVTPVASNLIFGGGDADVDDMIKDVKDGVLIESGVVARSDPRTLRFAARGARAREIKAGRTTGRLFGDVDLIGSIPDLLASTRKISRQLDRVTGSLDAPRSIVAPYLLTTARVSKG